MYHSRLRDILTLIRLPNLFTVAADVLMGLILAGKAATVTLEAGGFPTPSAIDPFGLNFSAADDRLALWLVVASMLLYMAGVVLNDVFDVEIDRRERPERPLPAGRISVAQAATFGWGLLVLGLAVVGLIASLLGHWLMLVFAGALAVCIVGYNAWLKRTPLGPIAMGACRTLNILMAMSIFGYLSPSRIMIACAIGVYIAGVTWYARDEADTPRRSHLIGASIVMLIGLGMLMALPLLAPWDHSVLMSKLTAPGMGLRWPLAVGVVMLATAWHCSWAIQRPTPGHVQVVVGRSITWLIFIDGLVVAGGHSLGGGVIICMLYLLSRSARRICPPT